jgi:hypothetical protein
MSLLNYKLMGIQLNHCYIKQHDDVYDTNFLYFKNIVMIDLYKLDC